MATFPAAVRSPNKTFIFQQLLCNTLRAFCMQHYQHEGIIVKHRPEPSSTLEKERIRNEINEQVDDFLRSGGQINVLTNNSKSSRFSSVGSVWSDPDDFAQIPEQS